MSKIYKVGELLEVSVVKIVSNGFGLAFADGLTVFVPLSAPGDRLRVKIDRLKGKIAFAPIVEILEPSIQRIEPKCGYFGRCGGCDFQQMTYEAQIEAKISVIRDCLVRIGKIDFAGEISIIPSPSQFGYRSRAQWHASKRRTALGYFEQNSDRVVDIEDCPILTGDLQHVLSDLRNTVDWNSLSNETIRIEAAAADGQTSVFSNEIVERTHEISIDVRGHTYFYNANVFFQGNLELIKELVETATSGAEGSYAIDLYCGVGLFTLPLAEQFAKVSGVEEYGPSLEFAKKSAAQAGLENLEFRCERVVEFLSESTAMSDKPEFVLLDPPRSGTEKGTIETLLRSKPAQISYISCEPSILARDLAILTTGGYQIESITAIDLFPQTHHIETVVRLSLA